MLLSVTYALIYGVYCALGSTLSNLFNPFGFTPTEVSIVGAVVLMTGVVAALIIGYFLD